MPKSSGLDIVLILSLGLAMILFVIAAAAEDYFSGSLAAFIPGLVVLVAPSLLAAGSIMLAPHSIAVRVISFLLVVVTLFFCLSSFGTQGRDARSALLFACVLLSWFCAFLLLFPVVLAATARGRARR